MGVYGEALTATTPKPEPSICSTMSSVKKCIAFNPLTQLFSEVLPVVGESEKAAGSKLMWRTQENFGPALLTMR